MTVTTPALRYFGAKWRMASWIIKHFPAHDCYVEPYGGSAAVLLRKPPVRFEVYNDKDQEVTNFFSVLRSTPDLVRLVELTPYSQAELRLSYEHSDDPVERARRFFVRSWQGWAGPRKKQRTGWKRQKKSFGTRYDQVAEWLKAKGGLVHVCDRLLQVQIECGDALRVIRAYDTPSTLFYVDPPYPGFTIAQRWAWDAYSCTLGTMDHVNLLNLLKTVDGKVVLSTYPNELYSEQLRGWKMVTKTTATVNHKKQATEQLWIKP